MVIGTMPVSRRTVATHIAFEPGHGRVLGGLKDHEPHVGVRVVGRQENVGVVPDRAAGLEQHQAADVVPLGPQELTLVEHGLTGDLADPAHDDLPARLPAWQSTTDSTRELHGTSLSMAQRFIGGDEVIGRLRGGDRCSSFREARYTRSHRATGMRAGPRSVSRCQPILERAREHS